MGRVIAICITVVAVLVIIAIVVVYHRRKKSRERSLEHGWALKGDLNRKQELELAEANQQALAIFSRILHPANLSGEFSVLASNDRKEIENWISRYPQIGYPVINRGRIGN